MDYFDAIVQEEKRRNTKTRYDWSKIPSQYTCVVQNKDEYNRIFAGRNKRGQNPTPNGLGWSSLYNWEDIDDISIVIEGPVQDYRDTLEWRPGL